MTRQQLQDAIESLVDSFCADDVKDALASVCGEKAEHIRSTYGADDEDANVWESLAEKLAAVPNLGV